VVDVPGRPDDVHLDILRQSIPLDWRRLPMTPRIDRRSFLALGVGAVAWACGRGGNGPKGTEQPGDDAISVVATSAQGLAIGDTRQAFAVFRGQRPTKVEDLSVKLVPPEREPFDVEVEHVAASRGPGGKSATESTEVADIYVIRHDFDRPGVWSAELRFDGGRGKTDFLILQNSPSPIVGKKAIASKTPTTDDDRGVDPICTRTPACSMHDVSIDDALAAGKPSVLVFGTPRYCSSRTCGPVVDFVELAKDKYEGDATFIHIEQWKDDKSVGKVPDGLAPVFAEWKFDTEPWIYFVDADGVVRDRWLGAVGPDEVKKAVKALV
jgi:hypothetical protein